MGESRDAGLDRFRNNKRSAGPEPRPEQVSCEQTVASEQSLPFVYFWPLSAI